MATTLARTHRARAPQPDGGSAVLKVGDLLAGKYRVQRVIGEGGMGVVVAAHHELLDQDVAVKLLYRDVADREAQSRLLLEARACAKLQSEHVARVVDVDTGADGLPFIVMELLDGVDLCQVADARGALPRWLVVDYVLQALEGLAHAHARGIIHRDLKPSNLFLANRADGAQLIKILDFGISKSIDPSLGGGAPAKRDKPLSGGGAVLGSPPYMSPEQVRSPKTVDHRTDIWSLGVVMYELLTNSMPFGGETVSETLTQILDKEPPSMRQIVGGVPEGLERAVMQCLAKNRDKRFADVAELARALAPFGSGTWIQSADRVRATLARGAPEPTSSGRLAEHGPLSDRIAIPASRGSRAPRRDSLKPELTSTASTSSRGFAALGPRGRLLLALTAVLALAGVVLIAGTAFQRSRARARAEASEISTADAAAVGAGVPVSEPTAAVTAPVHLVGPESEGLVAKGGAGARGTVIGASPLDAGAKPAAVVPVGASAPAAVPSGRRAPPVRRRAPSPASRPR